MRDIEDLFDDNNLEKHIKKAKKKTNLKIIVIAIAVFVVGSILNTIIGLIYSQKTYARNEAYIKLTVPNGYISESNDIIGFLGGNGVYEISKVISGRKVILEDRVSLFGLIPPINYTRMKSRDHHDPDDWPVSRWTNGYRRMRFFHPEIKYEEYQNDLENLDNIPDNKNIEMAISFDKPYKMNDLFVIQEKLKSSTITWLWLDEFTEKSMEKFKYETENHDAQANGIYEYDTIGISYEGVYKSGYGFNQSVYNEKYDELIDALSKSKDQTHEELYKDIMTNGKTIAEDAEILGVVVQGTKEELKELIGNPIIKSSSFGVIVDPLY